MRHFIKALLISKTEISDQRSVKNHINMFVIVIYEDLGKDDLPSQEINGQS